MIPNYPYFGLPNCMRYLNPNIYSNANSTYTQAQTHNKSCTTDYAQSKHVPYTTKGPVKNQSKVSNKDYSLNSTADFFQDSSPLFSILGFNFYFDDVLLLCIIFFLYNEKVNEPYLFFALILLLLS